MAENSKIEWCHHTLNPWRGCSKVSEGCDHCYAERGAKRNPAMLGIWGVDGTRVIAAEAQWRAALKWDRRAAEAGERHRVFCASYADVFEDRPELVEPRGRLMGVIDETPHLDWLLLTKRPESILRLWPGIGDRSNVWVGTSVENQEQGDKRIPELLKVPAAVRFISAEPLLGPVDLSGAFSDVPDSSFDPGVHWVISGGESGPNARPMDPAWATGLRDQCQEAGVAFFFKQWGEWAPALEHYTEDDLAENIIPVTFSGSRIMAPVGKKRAGRLLGGREWNEFPVPICIGSG